MKKSIFLNLILLLAVVLILPSCQKDPEPMPETMEQPDSTMDDSYSDDSSSTENELEPMEEATDDGYGASLSTISGTVTGSGRPLFAATVTATETNATVTTDQTGSFSLELSSGDLISTTVELEFSAPGYIPQKRTVTLIDNRASVTIDLDAAK